MESLFVWVVILSLEMFALLSTVEIALPSAYLEKKEGLCDGSYPYICSFDDRPNLCQN